MQPLLRASALVPGVATGVGSLPHRDAREAALAVLRCLPDMSEAPLLPCRDPREGIAALRLSALPVVQLDIHAGLSASSASDEPPRCLFDPDAHGCPPTFVDILTELEPPPARVKAQVTGPLTLGFALAAGGMAPSRAFRRAGEVVRAWMVAL